MTNISILVDGEQAKKFNKAVKELQTLTPKYKELDETMKKLREEIKEICGNNTKETQTYESTQWTCQVKYSKETIGIDQDKLKTDYPEIYDLCYGKVTRKDSYSIGAIVKK